MGGSPSCFSRNTLKSTKGASGQTLRAYPILVKLLKTKKPVRIGFIVKPRDICIVLGVCDKYSLTMMGRLLALLEKNNLAVSWNSSRPKRYLLHDPVFMYVREICRLDEKTDEFCIETGCSLLGICPYWVLKQWR